MPNALDQAMAARRPNTANTINGENKPMPTVPPFHSRRTLAEHVHDNMQFANRLALQHRVGVVASNSATKSREEVKEFLEAAITAVNLRIKDSEQITGLVVLYPAHTVMVLTGADRSLGQIKDAVGLTLPQYFTGSRIFFFHGNVNQRYTSKVLFCFGDPPVLIMKGVGRDFDHQLYYVQVMVKRITYVCKVMAQHDQVSLQLQHENTEDDDEMPVETIDVQQLLPEVAILDYVLQIDHLMTLDTFLALFESIPAFDHYDEKVWPIPYDFTPNNIYDNGKYDINLIFGKPAPKATTD